MSIRITKTLLRLCPALVAALLLSSCDDLFGVGERGELRHRLDAAEAKWDAAGVDDYAFTLQLSCFCGYNGPVRITVVNDVITDVQPAEGSDPFPEGFVPSYPTIRELFAIVRDAIEMPASDLRAEFDAGDGFPTDIYVDWHAGIADDEIGYLVSDVTGLIVLMSARPEHLLQTGR